MCTAITYRTQNHYFGRNLDLEYSYHETVTVTPRRYPFAFQKECCLDSHWAMIGMAYVVDGYPLYYDATNEKGLSMAGLSFPGNAVYHHECNGKKNIAPFEFIPWILGRCSDLSEAKAELGNINLIQRNYSAALPLSPLHWIIADQKAAVTVECVSDGLKVYENPVGILTNNPPFPYHMLRLADYMAVTGLKPENRFSSEIVLRPYSLGMGSIGLPGDMSSSSRFVRAAFTKFNSRSGKTESESISQFFHILAAASQPKGCTQVRDSEYEFTLYSSCCNTDRGIYYYRTYENSQISAVDMYRENLDDQALKSYPLMTEQQIWLQNKKGRH